MNDLRIVEIWTTKGWLEVEMKDLKVGDRFRMFEPTGEQVVNTNDSTTEWIVSRPPMVGEYGVYEVEIYGQNEIHVKKNKTKKVKKTKKDKK